MKHGHFFGSVWRKSAISSTRHEILTYEKFLLPLNPGVMKSYRTFLVLALFPLTFLMIFFYFPLLSILKEGFWEAPGRLTAQYLLATLKEPYNRRVMLFTLTQAVLSTGLTFVLGFPGAYLAAKFTFPGKSLLKAITTVPFVLPSIIVSLGFVLLFGNNGAFNKALMAVFNLSAPPLRILYSLKAIVLSSCVL